MRRFKGNIFIVLALALMFSSAAAQVPTGKITGKVTDNQGVPLPGVTITADSPRLVGQANAVTDDTGVYRIFSLPAGTYSIRFTLPGFRPLTRRDILVQLEQTIALNVSLEQSTIAEDITVIGQSPLIDVKSTTKGSTMTKEVFMQLPRNRNFDGLLSTVPGVQYEGNQGGLSVDGASGTENIWYVDGTNVTNVHLGYRSQSIVMEQLEEVKVTASGYTAEFGGSMGGVVNVISRSGGNEFRVELYGYYDNNKLWMQGKGRDSLRLNPYAYPYVAEYYNSDDLYYDGGKNRDDRQRFEGVLNLSGYILKDRLWFFGSFDPTYERTYGDRWFTSDPVDLTKAKNPGNTQLDPRQGRQLYNFYQKSTYPYWQAKLTAAPIKGMRMSVSAVNNTYWYGGSFPGITGTSAKAYSYRNDWEFSPDLTKGKEPGYTYPNWSGNTTIDYTVSNNFLASFRGGFFHMNTSDQKLFVPGTSYTFSASNMMTTPPYDAIPDSLKHFSGWSNGAGTTVTKKRIYDRLSANLDLTYYLNLAGEHSIKAGFQYIRLHEDVDSGPVAPLVALYWNQPYYMPDGAEVMGTYGHYEIRNDWVSAYGSNWNIASNNWAIYLQDSWTIGEKFTLNLGVRTESEYVPSLATNDPNYKNYKPIKFGFDQKLAPRLGLVYDVFGDSSLKVFGSFGVYYDVMKLYMAEGAYGGFKWWTSYYTLDDYDWTKIAASGDITNKADQAACGKYMGSSNERTTSWDTTEPNMKPVSQSEVSFGAEKKLTEEFSFSARLVYKHLIRTIEDVGVELQDAQGNWSEQYYIANPGEGWTRPVSQGGRFADIYWPCPKPKREYYALNLALEKRFSNNWQGGISYTWSRMTGNYGGLSSSDESGRNSPNVERYWDLYFERYDIHGRPLDGVLPSDRPHYIKAFGSYMFPFGLTVGTTVYGMAGLPRTTNLNFNGMQIFADGYFDTGKRTPFLLYADLYLEYNLRIAKKYTINLNTTIFNFTNTSTITGYYERPNYTMLRLTDAELIAQKTNYKDWRQWLNEKITVNKDDPRYGMWTSRYGAWYWRLGARLSF
jgi:hypothetical protein